MSPIAKNVSVLAGNVHRITFLVLGVICMLVRPGLAQQPSPNAINTDASPPTNTVVANITVGTDAAFAAVSPDSTTVYVTSRSDNTVSVINASTNEVTSVISVGSTPIGLALTPDGTTLYVSNLIDGTVSVIDTATNAVIGVVKVGDIASRLGANPNGKTIYVPFSTGIRIIDTGTNQITATVPVKNAQPVQVLFNRDGTYAYALCQVGQSNKGNEIYGILQINTSSLVTKEYLWNQLPGSDSAVTDISKNTLLITEFIQKGNGNAALAVFDTVTGAITGKAPFKSYDGGALMPAITPNGAYAYVPTVPDIIIVDIATRKAVGEPIPIEASFVAIAPNGKYAYAGATIGNPKSHGAVLVIAIGPK